MVHETPMLLMAPPFVPTFPLNVSSRDEERCRQRAGEVVMLNDTTGKGHRTRVIENDPVRIAAIHLYDYP